MLLHGPTNTALSRLIWFLISEYAGCVMVSMSKKDEVDLRNYESSAVAIRLVFNGPFNIKRPRKGRA